MYRFIYAIDFYIIYYLKEMREIIKMIFFRGMFGFGLSVAIALLYLWIEGKIWDKIFEVDEIKEKNHKDEIKALESRNRFLEEYWSERMRRYYELSIEYYDMLNFKICWKSVSEWKEDDKKVVKENYPRKKK